MKLLNNIRLLALFLVVCATANAQQDPNYTFYRYNMNIYNPAFVGSSEAAEFALGIRSQWAGIEGAPESQSAIFAMPVGKNVGLGASILNDRTFIEQQTWVAIDVSYNVQLDEEHTLYFGIKGSANSYDANTQGLVTYGVGQDGALMDYESRFTPNVGAGVYLKHDRYFASLSAPKLLTPDRLQERDGNAFLGVDRMHAYLSGGYTFLLGKTLDLKTMGMFRYVDASPISVEVTGILDFGERFEFGASYRHDESISGLFLFNIGNGFNLGYAYETSIQNPIDGLDNNTHELFMRLKM
ncbi:MAG: type IX secretion system membrane protein PorP/SprF [Muricauda sp.]|jgi:type IX secretion system PorP/SprF family membrane protein|nr:type IX secretion system membrane protein PorP/SprF [Allomuricauda sp.]MBO6590518.1 type IX secretion system membrane protein PorP/SprF [Allomuricauda sp.]MBO6620170.1 type IX secretion system membrane protein PorP/SprF [Allomuricauda sp.]MBO6646039.1 type IX secretion system membrane protein PorP/SprF [Allomuricauda sp.]MBO6748482.1 type IX secretion system membrane protein PorP/SprF [Allomuricauda sp.]MBO6830681.1 type IX secretion system membrane protein PorP/SprF [Allomuricauda sp.]